MTDGSASADAIVSVPDLHASGPSSAITKHVHGSAIQSRHTNRKKLDKPCSTTTKLSVARWRVKTSVPNAKVGPSSSSNVQRCSPSRPQTYQWFACSGESSKMPTPVRTDSHRALLEWRAITQRIGAGEDLASVCAEQTWINNPASFEAINARIKGWHADCAKCADLCMGPLSTWLRHLRGPHGIQDAVSLDCLDPKWTLIWDTYRHLDQLALQGR
jgi:hypothetical protein